MSVPAQSPQGDTVVRPPKTALFSKLKGSFTLNDASSSVVPATAQAITSSKSDVIEKIFAPTLPVPSQVSVGNSIPVNAIVPMTPAETHLSQEEEFSPEFLSTLLAPQNEEAVSNSAQNLQQDQLPPNLAAAVPTAVAQTASASLNPAHAQSGTVKEAAPATPATSFESIQVQTEVPGMQYVESEPHVEMSPEVESFLTSVENHHEQLPKEVVIADSTAADPVVQPLAQPVVVLPITPEIEKKGAKKNPQFSVRWLVEWSHKMMKMFAGRIIYRAAA